ncbi:hypothetical protein AYO44_01370 [Planctomycetaceae bacterium SCGC AG-212-F19]|nr:hypothetical protein AYO44_01370 [Planctomycetaceae bacterium SCGC AG-212-F19]
MAKDCPRCGLLNPPEAQRCDCGYDFASRTLQQSYLGTEKAPALASPTPTEIIICVLLPLIGLILGFQALSRGRRHAGKVMLLVSVAMFFVFGMLRVLIMAGS